jgi:hypothetical protein
MMAETFSAVSQNRLGIDHRHRGAPRRGDPLRSDHLVGRSKRGRDRPALAQADQSGLSTDVAKSHKFMRAFNRAGQFGYASGGQSATKLAMLTEMARPLLAKLPAMIDVTPGADVEPQGNPSTVSPNLSY